MPSAASPFGVRPQTLGLGSLSPLAVDRVLADDRVLTDREPDHVGRLSTRSDGVCSVPGDEGALEAAVVALRSVPGSVELVEMAISLRDRSDVLGPVAAGVLLLGVVVLQG